MNKGISKWPSKVLNLLVVLSMVIALCAVLATPVAAQECNPTQEYDGCQLEVAVNTYIKDADGNFIPEDTFDVSDCFYVNAVVVNTGNDTAIAPINATIDFPDGGVELSGIYHGNSNEDTAYMKQWLGNLTYAAPDGLIADFWWKVCCTSANGYDTIRVNATAAVPCQQLCPASGTTEVYQGTTAENKCLDVVIVEAPGMPDYQGILGNYHMTVPGVVNPCTNFGIKAEITNNCAGLLTGVKGTLSWSGSASIVGNDPLDWSIGDLSPGQTKAVGWTLHCDDPGDVNITVTSSTHSGIVNPDYTTVHQAAPGGLEVRITQPDEGYDCTYTTQPIKQPYGVGACASASLFTVKALVTNTGDAGVINIYAIASATPATGWVSITSPIFPPFALAAGASQEVTYAMRCIGEGDGNITVNASGTDLSSGLPVVAMPDVAEIAQMSAIAQVSPDPLYATPDEVNKCQEFAVTFRYTNYTASGWNVDSTHGNVTACINWNGPAELDGPVYYRRIVGGIPESWQVLNANPTGNATVGDCENLITVVCPCCSVDVRWHFKCTDAGDCGVPAPVSFYSTLTVDQNSPVIYHAEDTSETVCVDQVWKAHLTGDTFFFIQDDNGKMILQNAVVPGTDFHVVIPVINTGDAEAQNVQVYFTISDDPTGDCIKSYTFESSSGDGTVSFNAQTGVGIASLGDIPGHSAKKVILLLHCNCEGHVSIYIPDLVTAWGDVKGIRGFDENTGEAIPQDNISTPPCPRVLEQIPFTVVIENPYTCQTFNEGVTFPVKAKVSNGSILDLADVSATLSWYPGDPVELVQTQTMTKTVGNITAGSYDEITWELRCTGSGDVHLTVSATLPSPLLTAISDTVTVHQVGIPHADVWVEILSPDNSQHGQDWDVGRKHAMIATGQEFAVSAKVANDGPSAATNVTVTIEPYNCDSLHYATLVDGETAVKNVGTLGARDFTVVTWTLWGGSDHDYAMSGCSAVNDTICVNATTDTLELDYADNDDSVSVSVYPAAFLIATIDDITPASPFVVCEEFVVDYTVTNYGVADAWNTSVTLSVNPGGSVRIAEGEGGYTQYLGTIPGWSWGAPFNSVEGSFTLHCKALCESTLTITPAGDDECGWHALVGEECYERENGGDYWECEPQYNWVQFAGRPIESRFIIPASETVKQVVSKPITGDMTEYDIDLASGWNLVSLPLIPNSTAIGTVLADVDENTNIVWAYDAATAGWTSWVPGLGGDLTAMADGKGYWINMDDPDTLTIYGVELKPAPHTPKSYPVVTGWNLIGFKSTTARTAGDYLAAIAGDWTRMYTYGSAKYSAVGTDDMMNPGKGYWIAVTAAGTIYP